MIITLKYAKEGDNMAKKGQFIPEGTNDFDDVVHLETTASQVIEEPNKKFMTDAERIKLTDIEAGARKLASVDDVKQFPNAGGSLTGIGTAHSNTSYGVRQMRNIILSPSDAVLASMQDGDIWIKYK